MNAVWPILSGIQAGTFLSESYRMENSNRAGHHYHLMTTLLQGLQIMDTASIVDTLSGAIGRPAPFGEMSSLYYFLPPGAITLVVQSQPRDPCIKNTALQIHDSIGIVCHVAAIVSSVAMMYFGHAAYSVALLSTLALSYFDQEGMIPNGYRHIFHDLLTLIGNVMGLFSSGYLIPVFSFLDLLDQFAPYAFKMFEIPHVPDLGATRVTRDTRLDDLRANPGHVHYPLPLDLPAPDVDLNDLKKACQQVDWSAHGQLLRAKLGDDDRYQERGSQLAPGEYVQSQLDEFVDAVIERRILAGEPNDYELLTRFLKHITQHVHSPGCSEVDQVDILLKLAVDGGGYCGPQKYRVAEEIFLQYVVPHNPHASLQSRILVILHQQREICFQSMIYQSAEAFLSAFPFLRCVFNAMELFDVHNYHVYLNCMGDPLGIRSAAANEDALAGSSSWINVLYGYYMQSTGMIHRFWQTYTADAIIDQVKDSIGTAHLPKEAVYHWFRNWDPSEAWQEALENGILEERGIIKDQYIRIMLLEMGILSPL